MLELPLVRVRMPLAFVLRCAARRACTGRSPCLHVTPTRCQLNTAPENRVRANALGTRARGCLHAAQAARTMAPLQPSGLNAPCLRRARGMRSETSFLLLLRARSGRVQHAVGLGTSTTVRASRSARHVARRAPRLRGAQAGDVRRERARGASPQQAAYNTRDQHPRARVSPMPRRRQARRAAARVAAPPQPRRRSQPPLTSPQSRAGGGWWSGR